MANGKKKNKVQKIDLTEADDLFGGLSDDKPDYDDDMYGLDDFLYDDTYTEIAQEDEEEIYDEQYEEGDDLYDDTFSDIALGDEEFEEDEDYTPLDEEVAEAEDEQLEEEAPEPAGSEVCSALLEHVGGIQQEVSKVKLFKPEENTLLTIDEDGDEQIVFFDQLSCVRVSSLPHELSDRKRESSTKEIIETVDGKFYHELVNSNQEMNNILICYTADKESPYTFTLIPKSNIKKRTLDTRVVDLLLEKRFISKSLLKRALHEFEQAKSMTLEGVIAQKAGIPIADIENAINEAQQGPMQGMPKEEVLLFSGLVTEQHILDAVDHLEKFQGLRISQFLVQKGFVKEKNVYASLAEKHKLPFIDLFGRKFSKKYIVLLPKNVITQHEILPIALKDDILLVATHYIDMEHLTEKITKSAGCKHVKYVLSPPGQLKKIIHMLFAKKK